MPIPFTLSNVSDTAVSEINADATLTNDNSGNRLMFCGITVASKGKPFSLLSVNKNNIKKVLGKPFHPNYGQVGDSLRQVNDAVNGGDGLIVRVVPDNAKYPVITFASDATKASKTPTSNLIPKTSALSFNQEVELIEGDQIAFYIKDGSSSTTRTVELKQANESEYGSGMYEVIVTEKDITGTDIVIGKHIGSLNPVAVDDMGMPSYLCTVLENQSDIIDVILSPTLMTLPNLPKTTFVGGTDGDINSISQDAYIKAVDLLKSSMIQFTHVLGLGCYNTDVIKSLIDIANGRRISSYFDINPQLSYKDAAKAKSDMAITDHRSCFYHLPFSAMDPTYQTRAIWGISGVVFTAKAIGVAQTSPVGGWHYTPAGEMRATIHREGMKQLPSAGVPDFELMYSVRINKLAINKNGYVFIDDSITSCPRNNYLRFEQIVSVTDAISRDIVDLSDSIKHQPDGLTYDSLTKGVTRILDGYVTTTALVPPSNPKIDGKNPYILQIKKTDKDKWELKYGLSITGSARRILCVPILIA